MTKVLKWSCILVGSFLIVMLGIGLFGTEGGSESRLRWTLDEVAYYIRNGRRRPKISMCKINLEMISISKLMWASENGKTTNDIPTWDDLREHWSGPALKGIPICPEGGTYTINRVRERPTCSIGGSRHSMTLSMPKEEGVSPKKEN